MATYLYPTNAELREIAQVKVPILTQADPVFDFFPIEDVDAPVVMWEQQDNYTGLQQLRGLGGAPQRVKATGGKRYVMEPGVYGEFEPIDEVELTMRRPYGQFNGAVPVTDMVTRRQDKLLGRELDRIRYIIWTLLVTGTFSVSLPTGGVAHTDSYTTQTYSGSAWGTPASGTPLADFRAIQLLSRGSSSNFGTGAMAFMNRVTANKLLANTNGADIGGKRTAGLFAAGGAASSSIYSLAGINELLTGEGLPNIVIYDEGYLDDSGTFQPFIANNKTVIVGTRPGGARIGAYQKTRNVNTPGMAPGSYDEVIDRGSDGPGKQIPMLIEVHRGHNGGPALEFPGAVVVATTT